MIRVLCLLVLLALSPFAQADTHTSQSEAYSHCMQQGSAAKAARPDIITNTRCVHWNNAGTPYYQCEAYTYQWTMCRQLVSSGEYQHEYTSGQCSARTPLLNMYFQGDSGACNAGCEFAPELGAGVSNRVVRVGTGSTSMTRVSRMVPTGQACTVGEGFVDAAPQTTEKCQKQGNLTQCLTADGRTCAVASSGKKFCWEPSEAGTKLSGNEAATKSPEGTAVKQPPKAPNNGGEWQQGGTGTVSVSGGGVTNNYNTTNWNSSYGNQGSGANGGGADGEGNGGSGDGSGEGEGDGDDWGEPGAGVGDLYEGTDKTVAGLVGQFWDQARAAPVFQGVTNFMGINAAGGACPVFTLPASDFWNTMTFDAHCSGTWLALLQAMGWVVFAIASYVAVRIAVT